MTAQELDIRRLERRTRGSGRQPRDADWPSSTRPGIRIVDLPTAQVRVRIASHGPRTLVFACDMPNVVESYDVLFHLLQDDFRVVCFEQPGFGFSYPKRGFDSRDVPMPRR
jgi:hypothetical protein